MLKKKNIIRGAIAALLLLVFLFIANNSFWTEEWQGIIISIENDAQQVNEDVTEDVLPKPLAYPLDFPDPSRMYAKDLFAGTNPEELLRFKAIDKTYFPYFENGKIYPPRRYAIEEKYSVEDQEKMKQALKAAYQYADINKAFRDGYRLIAEFASGMGIHMLNIKYIQSDAVNLEEPEFLSYVLNSKTEQYQLGQFGYIHKGHRNHKRYPLFDTDEAQGHYHPVSCYPIRDKIFQIVETCDEASEGFVGPVWMLHVALNLHNERGMFSDSFPLLDYFSVTAAQYSFFGENIQLGSDQDKVLKYLIKGK